MPRIAVQLVADTIQYTKGLTKAAAQTEEFGATLNKTSKGIGRSLAFATGGFVAIAGATDLLRASIDAARDTGVAQKQLAAQVKASGESWQANQAAISKAELSLEKYGFTSEDSAKALTVLERGTGKITEAMKLQGAAADLARAKNETLSDAANTLAKVFGGQETALRRAVPGLDKQAHGLDLIAEAQQRLSGQAAAGTTVSEKFEATLHNTEVIIGNALLPTINRLLTSLGDWLDKMNRSGQLQRDLNTAVKDGTGIMQAIEAVVKPLAAAFKTLGDVVGGTKNEVELLIGAFVVLKSAKYINGLDAVSTAMAGIGTKAVVATGEVEGLGTQLGLLARNPALSILALGAADIFLGKKALTTSTAGSFAAGAKASPYQKGSVLNDLYQAGLTGTVPAGVNMQQLNAAEAQAYRLGESNRPSGSPAAKRIPATSRVNVPGGLGGSIAQTNRTLTPEQALQVALAANPSSVSLLQQQAAFDRSSIAFLQKLHAQGKGPGATKLASELEGFYGDLNSTLGTITSINQAAADKIKAAGEKAAAATKKAKAAAAKAAAAAALAASRTALGRAAGGLSGSFALHPFLTPQQQAFNVPGSIQLAEARTTATGNTAGFDKALRSARTAARRALASGKLSLQAQIDAWNAIADVNQQLADTAKKTSVDVTSRHQAPLPRAFALAGGGGLTINGGLHLHGVQDVANLENELEARAKRRPQPRRGR